MKNIEHHIMNYYCQQIVRCPLHILVSFNPGMLRKYMGNLSTCFDCNIHNRNIKVLCLIRPTTLFSVNYKCQCNEIG